MIKLMSTNQPPDVEMVHFQVLSFRQWFYPLDHKKNYRNIKWFNGLCPGQILHAILCRPTEQHVVNAGIAQLILHFFMFDRFMFIHAISM